MVADGRAADEIDGRTIRFYQTLGILPKPGYEGRRAMYLREHLIRVVAAKKLQSEGYALAEIQAALPTRSTDELAAFLLSLDGTGFESRAPEPEVACASADSGPSPSRSPQVPTVAAMGSAPGAVPAQPSPVALATFQLAPGVHVLIDPRHAIDHARLAQDLLRALARSAHYSPVPAAGSMTKPHGGRDPGGAEPSQDHPPEPIEPDHGGKQ